MAARLVHMAMIMATHSTVAAYALSSATACPRSRMAPARAPPLAMVSEAPLSERAAASLVYLLPVADGFSYGAYVFNTVPGLDGLARAVLPAVNTFQSVPFAGLILFIGLSFFTRSTDLSRFVRYNIQMALLLDITLIIPSLLGGVGSMFPPVLQVMGDNLVFYYAAFVVGYCLFRNAQGKIPDGVPILSEAAAAQIGPF